MSLAAPVLGAVAAPLLLLARSRAPLLAGLAALAGAVCVLALASAGSGIVAKLASPLGAVALVGLVPVALGAAVLVRFPLAVPVAVLVAAPLRLPIAIDAGSPVLVSWAQSGALGRLYPLYLVLACTTGALAWSALRGRVRPVPLELAVPASAFLGLVSLSLLWSRDPVDGAGQLLFFWMPFTALLAAVARTPLDARATAILGGVLLAMTSVFAAIGIGEAATGRLLAFSPKVEAANTYAAFFRVTSVFEDPSLYGRHVVLGMVVALTAVWLARIGPAAGAILLALLGAGLYFSYSQSSFVALAGGVLLVTLFAGDRRGRLAVGMATGLVAVAGIGLLAVTVDGQSVRRLTSNRSSLIERTSVVIAEHPITGVGVAAQPLVTRDRTLPGTGKKRNASHNTPLTVLAEYGAVGLLAYLATLIGGARLALRVHARDPALGVGLLAALFVLFLHSLAYGQFLEDPLSWLVLGLIAAAVGARGIGPVEPGGGRASRAGAGYA